MTEEGIQFLRDLIHHLPSMHEFVYYDRRHRDMDGQRNGEIFNIFGDEWNFFLTPRVSYPENVAPVIDTIVSVIIYEDKFTDPGKCASHDNHFSKSLNVEKIGELIYNYYFKS
jgi:hypothetical protein